jgi:5-formyltetrahydrofolate cyclo-ligase
MTDQTSENQIQHRKTALRSSVQLVLAAMTSPMRHGASHAACQRLMGLDQFRHASTVMLYMPMSTEVDLSPVALRCFQIGKTVCVPKVVGHEIIPIEVTNFDVADMDLDGCGVRTPRCGQPVPPNLFDLVVVPGLAFDPMCRRLGRGGGYYDRFLPRLRKNTAAVGIAYDVQIVEEVPALPHDVTMDIVVTERRLIHAATGHARIRGGVSP